MKANWNCLLELDKDRKVVSGSETDLISAVKRAADVRVYTEFYHHEHIDTSSANREKVKEVADFRVTYLLDNRWVAGIINLRQPIELPNGFGPRPSMSFFLYNQNADQAIARPYLDGQSPSGNIGASPLDDHTNMPKYHQFDSWDAGSNAPSSNFVYDFEVYRFWACDEWQEVFANNEQGEPMAGSIAALVDAFKQGKEIKVGISGLCADLGSEAVIDHEVFIHCGSTYYYSDQRLFIAASHPVVRVAPAIPLKYRSEGWDFGWLMPRTDGLVAQWLVDPYALKFTRNNGNYAIRWFVR